MKYEGQKQIKLEAKNVLPNISHTQATEGPKNAVFCPLVTLAFDQ